MSFKIDEKITFQYTHTDPSGGTTDVKMCMHNSDQSLTSVIEQFELFLRSIGYIFGKLEYNNDV